MVSETRHEAFIGLGSNLGRRKKNIAAALNALQSTREIEVIASSGLYETEPEGGPENQARFINSVARIGTILDAERLLAVCQHIEDSLGRKRTIRWGPRTIDLDVLSFDDEIRAEPDLTLPHPMMHERVFVMRPLAELAPDWVHPVLERTAQSILESLDARV
ncbi:MAG: 2-amino-4-hydroxy-6-hydroxymethyldihydropteridine diphosphokinase [Phycisphaerae bacterium]